MSLYVLYDPCYNVNVKKRKHSSHGLGAFVLPERMSFAKVMHMYSADQIQELISAGCIEHFYKDWYWRTLALEIIREHHKECQMCRNEHRLTCATLVHHVKPLKLYPELAYSRTYKDADGEHIQLMPLCHDCHERMHERGIYAKPHGFVNEEKW